MVLCTTNNLEYLNINLSVLADQNKKQKHDILGIPGSWIDLFSTSMRTFFKIGKPIGKPI